MQLRHVSIRWLHLHGRCAVSRSLSRAHHTWVDAAMLQLAFGGSRADLRDSAQLSGPRIRRGLVVCRMRRWKLHYFQD